jgi:hypothetical protein
VSIAAIAFEATQSRSDIPLASRIISVSFAGFSKNGSVMGNADPPSFFVLMSLSKKRPAMPAGHRKTERIRGMEMPRSARGLQFDI